MNILILGSGGREHAFATVARNSPLSSKVYVSPGNGGTSKGFINCEIDLGNFYELKRFLLDKKIELVIIGPEAPLVEGLKDQMDEDKDLAGLRVLGPGKPGARLEGSKSFAKEFMQRHGVPTAAYKEFTIEQKDDGIAYLNQLEGPYVLKADGLAAGKGVFITTDRSKAIEEFCEMLGGKFGSSSSKVVIEEYLDGIEFSVFALTDGKNYILLPEAKDYKRIGDGDTGPNTGGMGSVSPVYFFRGNFKEKVIQRIIEPTIKGLQNDEIPYCGFIFFGLIKVGDDPYVIEYNCRMGDPETQSVFPRIQSDLIGFILKAIDGELNGQLQIDQKTTVSIILASGGYPGNYQRNKEIFGLENISGSCVYHSGTREEGNKIFTSGGRVLAITAQSELLEKSIEVAYADVNRVCFEGITYRKDIGNDLLKLGQK